MSPDEVERVDLEHQFRMDHEAFEDQLRSMSRQEIQAQTNELELLVDELLDRNQHFSESYGIPVPRIYHDKAVTYIIQKYCAAGWASVRIDFSGSNRLLVFER